MRLLAIIILCAPVTVSLVTDCSFKVRALLFIIALASAIMLL